MSKFNPFAQKPVLNIQEDQNIIVLEHDKEVTLVSVTDDSVAEEFQLIQQNEAYLNKAGEGYPNIYTSKQYCEYLLSIYGDFQAIQMKRFRIFYKGTPCGQIGLHSFIVRNLQPTAEIFYWIDENFQRKGIVTRALERLQAFAFNTLQVEVLYIHALTVNVKSQNVALRCHFKEVGVAKYRDSDGIYQEYKRYAKTVEDFEREQINEFQ